jgi:hypothetical protein
MLRDFEEFKKLLSVVNKSFVTLGKPLKIYNTSIYFRDTQLLAPVGKSSLEQLGELYISEGDYTKRSISIEDKSKMSNLLKRNKKVFEEYAIQDVKITLKHATEMERFNMSIQQLGVPLTLSSIGKNYVFENWRNNLQKFLPYQISGKCLMGNADEVQTPKGLFATGDVGLHLSYYIGNYKGGRNESFMYGAEDETIWYDYDLVSAYTTGMTDLSLPAYSEGKMITFDEIEKWSSEQLLKGYLILYTTFKFLNDVKYPSIPCYVDENTTVYPLEGTCLITGPEYILAKNQGCEFDVKSVYFIPPTEEIKGGRKKEKIKKKKSQKSESGNEEKEVVRPFHSILKELQNLRKQHPKGTFRNLLYKDLGNSIYGNVVRGVSNKKAFDALTGKMFRVKGTDLSNPILASWTTAFIRSVIGECLHNISLLNGKVVSVTTDGFITDVDKLEEKLMSLPLKKRPLLTKYRDMRKDLVGTTTKHEDWNALEVKKYGKGIISWTTRGQLGVCSKIKATTGFQSKGFEHCELVKLFKSVLKGSEKFFEFTQQRLRSAKDIYTKGGHVTISYKDQKFRMYYDNRREVIEPEEFVGYDLSNTLLDTRPLLNIIQAQKRRFISKFPFTYSFNKQSSSRLSTKYRSYLEVGVRNFIKGFTAVEPYFGLRGDEFKSYRELMSFIYDFESTKGIKLSNVKLSEQSISNLKNRRLIWRPVPQNEENLKFVEYIKERLPHFKSEEFLMRV